MPLKKKEVESFRKQLLTKKEELLRTIDDRKKLSLKEHEPVVEEIDQAAQASEQALHLRLLDKDLKLLREINDALERIDTGVYGICEGTGEEIDRKRLELRPWTRYSIEYKEEMERKKKLEKMMR